MDKINFRECEQSSAYDSPWSLSEQIRLLLWEYCWALFCSWTPKPLNRWRLLWLKFFGCKIYGKPFVHQRARIQVPWHLILHDRACLGDRANAYSLGVIEIKARATVAQEAYLCAGSHNFSHPNLPLITAKLTIGEDAFVGTRAFVLPGVTIGSGTVIGACSVVTSDIEPWVVSVGNPARVIRKRKQIELLK